MTNLDSRESLQETITDTTTDVQEKPALVEAVSQNQLKCCCEQHKSNPDGQSSESTKLVQRMNRRVLFVLLGLLIFTLFPVFKMFMVPLTVAATLSAIFYPLYLWLKKITRFSKALSSLLCCLILVLTILVPTYLLVHTVGREAMDLYSSGGDWVKDSLQKIDRGIGTLTRSPLVDRFHLKELDWRALMYEGGKTIGSFATTFVNKTSAGFISLVLDIGILLFTMFYFFMDGEKLVNKLRYLSPLRREYEDTIISRFLLISRATIKGTVLIGLLQGTLGGLTLMVFGVKGWLVWGFVMIVLSILPLVGAWIVLLPAGLIQLALGNVWQGLGIIIVSLVVVSNVDNLIRPRLVGRDAKLHDLLVFFSTIGGIAVFGIMGFIVGPVLAALFVAVLDIYGLEFSDELSLHFTRNE